MELIARTPLRILRDTLGEASGQHMVTPVIYLERKVLGHSLDYTTKLK